MNCLECLPENISFILAKYRDLREIRLRNGCPVRVKSGEIWYWLSDTGLVSNNSKAAVFGEIASEVVQRACRNSVYAYEKQLTEGYMTLDDGSRLGVAGSLTETKDGKAVCFRNFTSVCIRVPHFIRGVSRGISEELLRRKGNVLVVGGPSKGKTTYLRDLACTLSMSSNVLIADERGEISLCEEFRSSSYADVLLWADKKYAFGMAVRSLAPDWIICDEISEKDCGMLETAAASGVGLCVSIHGNSVDDAEKRLGGSFGLFDYAVVLPDTAAEKARVWRKKDDDKLL